MRVGVADNALPCDSRKEKFAVEWYSTHTSDSVEYLRQGIIDVAITYHAVAELVALERGAAERIEYAWRDHWMLVGMIQSSRDPRKAD